MKLTTYFEKEECEIELKETAKKYSKELEVVNLNFNNLKELAANYKDGKYDEVDFSVFWDL